jgi:hypothetical protein
MTTSASPSESGGLGRPSRPTAPLYVGSLGRRLVPPCTRRRPSTRPEGDHVVGKCHNRTVGTRLGHASPDHRPQVYPSEIDGESVPRRRGETRWRDPGCQCGTSLTTGETVVRQPPTTGSVGSCPASARARSVHRQCSHLQDVVRCAGGQHLPPLGLKALVCRTAIRPTYSPPPAAGEQRFHGVAAATNLHGWGSAPRVLVGTCSQIGRPAVHSRPRASQSHTGSLGALSTASSRAITSSMAP